MSCFRWTEPDPFPSLRLELAVRTDRGRERPRNEDRAVVGTAAPFALVCDGMGGEAGGEVASSIASDWIAAAVERAWPWQDVETVLVSSIVEAGERVRAVARAEPRFARMGTTATLAAFASGQLVCAQVGDSRAYLLRRGRLAQVTRDQTMVELLRSRGVALGEDVPSNVILQAVGSSERLDVVVTRTSIEPGDVVLLCSDGLCGVVSDRDIASILATIEAPQAACDALVARANDAGGPDNITCVVARVQATTRSSIATVSSNETRSTGD